jgi:hypothetical protein
MQDLHAPTGMDQGAGEDALIVTIKLLVRDIVTLRKVLPHNWKKE